MEGWGEFYLLTGTAAATLAGLVFIALTVRPQLLERRGGGEQVLARQILGNYIGILIISCVALLPGQTETASGVEIALAGALGVVFDLARLPTIFRRFGRSAVARSQLVTLLAAMCITLGGIGTATHVPLGAYLAAFGTGWLLVVALSTSWVLVIVDPE